MSYTFAPLPPINTIDCHVGFYLVLAFALVLMHVAWAAESGWLMIVGIVLPLFAAGVSWNTGEYREYPNERVTGEFVRYVAEGYNVTVQSGKSTRNVDRHEIYVSYRINGNEVLFPAKMGIEYPKQAILYRN